ncbi:uncharacterized protein ASPGLDRAFT_1010564 [Aspergillus glaucus CBS 516.65]|uniref:Uncharacterized protein n=1 Tax=Aspergillus glaucus CBS 516.65 TaxID=1160497 RepID=A0A1L9VVN0_ASPGL|nr:hypothetical protein ASPGLDRAFT_1010564 [Aspergillus glaucus CBS 516.65]OJJ87956.1 hypothetical protein ASPGLDRAFT_1010564 [Aspergillus glaucus CBS 516.65]
MLSGDSCSIVCVQSSIRSRHKRIRKSEAPSTLSIAIMVECGFNALVPALIFSVNKVSYQ